MAAARAAAHSDAPWEIPDPLSCVQQLQALLGQGLNIDHDSTGDLQVLMHSALGGIRKEVDQHMDLLETEHVEHKTDPQYQRKMVRFWKCSSVTLHPSKTYNLGDSELDLNQVYFQWARMQNLPGWWVKKIWHSHEGWLLVATKEEFNLLIPDVHSSVDQRNLMEETLSSESSMEQQRQNMGANLARQALQHFLHLPEDASLTRDRSRSPRGNEDVPYMPAASVHRGEAGLPPPNNDEVTMPPALWDSYVYGFFHLLQRLREKGKDLAQWRHIYFGPYLTSRTTFFCPFSFGGSCHCSFESDLSQCFPLLQVGYFLKSLRQLFLLSSSSSSGRRLQDSCLESLIPAALHFFKHPFDFVPALPWRMEDPMEKPDLWMPLGTSLML